MHGQSIAKSINRPEPAIINDLISVSEVRTHEE